MSETNKFEEEKTLPLNDDTIDSTAQNSALEEKTLIHHDGDETQMAENFNFEVMQKGGKLVVMSSLNNGKEYLLTHSSLKLGRSNECELKLDYPGVSRQHASLNLENGKFVISDSGSKYGVFINGKKMSSPIPLKTGDQIQMGELSLKYIEGSQKGTSSFSQGQINIVNMILSKENMPLKIGVVLFFCFLIMLSFKLVNRTQEKKDTSNTHAEFVEKNQTRNTLTTELIKAKQIAKNGEYSQALFVLEGILAIDPSHSEAHVLQESWRKQITLKNKLDEIDQMIATGDMTHADSKLSMIISEYPENEKAAELKAKISQFKMNAKQTDTLSEAKKLILENRLSSAKNLLISIKDPALQESVQELQTQISVRESVNAILSEAEKLLSEGHIEKALESVRTGIQADASHAGCKEMELKLENIKKYQTEASQFITSPTPLLAREPLKKIMSLLGKNNPLYKQAETDFENIEAQTRILAQLEYQKALQLMADHKYSDAYQKIDTLSVNFPELNFIKDTKLELKVHLDNLGTALFQAGYIVEEVDPIKAKDIYRKVIAYLPRDHMYSLKARTKLKS